MTVTTTVRTAGPFTGTGLLSNYAFAFKVFLASDVLVQRTPPLGVLSTLVLGSDYTITLNANQETSPGGVVNLATPLALSATLQIGSQVPATQGVVLTNPGGWYPQVISDALDRQTILIQQANASLAGALRIPEATGTVALPSAAARANTVQGYDSLGAPTPVSLAVLPQRLLQRETQTVGAGQLVVTLATIVYSMGIGSLVVSARGGELINGVDYTETSTTSITLTAAPTRPIQLTFIAGAPVSSTVVGDATLVAVTPTGAAPTNVQAWIRGESTVAPSARGYWLDQGSGANIHRLRDRVFIGDGVLSSGNLAAPFGGSQLTTAVGNWFEKNSQLVVESTLGKIGMLGVSCIVAGMTSGTSIGAAGVGQASLAGSTTRGLYGDATVEAGATAGYAAELATANRGTDVTANSYTSTGGAYGLLIAHESASGYLLGDSSTPATDSTAPGTAAIIIKAGPGGTSNHQYRTGLIFFSNSLYGNDGTTGTSEAISLGKGMALNWYASSAILGGVFRCDTTAVAGHDVGIILSNDTISLNATASASSVPMLQLTRDTVSAGGVNYLTLANARTATSPTWQAAGLDANVGVAYKTKASAVHQFFTNTTEAFRVGANPALAVNFVQVTGSASGNPVKVAALGTDADIDVVAQGKGLKGGQCQDGAAAIKFQWNTTGIGFFAATPVAQSTAWGTPTGGSKLSNFPGATATLVQTSQQLAQLLLDLKAYGILGA